MRKTMLHAALRDTLRTAMEAWRIPGLSVAVATRPDGLWSEGFGLADVENDVAAGPDTVYRLASISKPITAVAIMQLAQRGKIDLDAPVQRYVSSFPEKPWPMTTRQLLGHLAGVRDWADDRDSVSLVHYPYGPGTSQLPLLDAFRDDPLLHEPGTAFRYTTCGYTLLGCIVEAAAGTDYLTYVRENILRPAGMDHTGPDDARAILPHRARGYALELAEDGPPQLRNAEFTNVSNHLAGGGFCGTAADVVRFGLALRDGVLLRSETQNEMFTRLRLCDGRESRYGLGWFVWTYRGEREVAHGGKHVGASTMFSLRPSSGIAVALLTNLEGLNSSQMHQLTRRLGDIAAGLAD